MPLPRCLITPALILTATGWLSASCFADLPALTVLHTFSASGPDDMVPAHHANSDGSRPEAPLTQGRDGTWYGTTSSGGANGTGVIFKMNSAGTNFTVLHSFGPLDALFGNSANADGCRPSAGLVTSKDGTLYGTATQGGPGGSGTVFKLNPDGSGFAVLHSFEPKGEMFHNSGGANPIGLTLGPDQALYGVTAYGGYGRGLIFKVAIDGKNFQELHSFPNVNHDDNTNTEGAVPHGPVTIGRDGTLYGTVYIGGKYGCGVLYKIGPDGKRFTVLHDFGRKERKDGVHPDGSLTLGPDNFLYACTRQGGADDGGVLYKIDTVRLEFTLLYTFPAPRSRNVEGNLPAGPLVFGPDGSVYGITGGGGEQKGGTVFKVSTNGTQFLTLYSFSMTEGGYTLTGLTLGLDGNLYGVSTNGGANGTGTIFRVVLQAAQKR